MSTQFKEFKPTSWAIDNRTSAYLLILIITLFGIINYNSVPKEQFPEIIIPTIIVSSIYPGTSPTDMEGLITRPLEKNIKAVNGVKTISSNSVQDFSSIVVEFNPDIDVSEAKQRIKDAVDKTKSDLPNDMPADPVVMEIDFSEIPIMYINISGKYDLSKLKKYADVLQDRIESLKEITRVDIVGALDREIQIDVDMYKMQAASVSFYDIQSTIQAENITIAGGSINMQNMQRSIRVAGEFKDIETIGNIVINSGSGAYVKLNEIATIRDSFKEQESFARLGGDNVITLNVIKKSGQNLLDASDKIKKILNHYETEVPPDVNLLVTGDMSRYTRNTLADLNNTIIIGFILVTLILMFFMGLTNAMFVALSVPLSMALACIFLPWIDFSMNMLVMFSFIFSLGIVVDDAIVVIENTHRIYNKKKLPITIAAKFAAGEVFMPVFSGTLTTIAPFVPLAFWPGITGKFMHYIPVVIILTLFSSLVVAYLINPVFAVSFMKTEKEDENPDRKKVLRTAGIIVIVSLLFYAAGQFGLANFIVLIALLFVAFKLYFNKVLLRYQNNVVPKIQRLYERTIRYLLAKNHPYWLLGSLVGLFFFTIVLTALFPPKIVFFPDNEPNSIYVLIKMPVGTDVTVTDSVTRTVEQLVLAVLGNNNPMVESVISNVALGASGSMFDSGNKTSNKGKVTVNFVEYIHRKGKSTLDILEQIRLAVQDIPGAEISVEKNTMGPPTGKPINIELSSENLDDLITTVAHFINYIDSIGIKGIEDLKSDFDNQKPELSIVVDRKRANNESITTGQIGSEVRTAVLGAEVSKYRDGEDQYPIQLRYNKYVRDDIERLMNHKITFMDMNSGRLKQIPLSSVATVEYMNTYGGITRKNVKRVITVSSNVMTGYTANEIISDIRKALPAFSKPESVTISITGEQEDQLEAMQYLNKSLLLALFLIVFILITQFNSVDRASIILTEVVFSIIGVLLGFIFTQMPMSIIMTGMGIVALAGIVIKNGILLVEFTDVLKQQKLRTREAIIQAGKIRLNPVLLTAGTTILGLIPLAVGFNINFETLFTHFDPQIYFGGDNVMFFGPLAWTIIFGLAISTFLTLIFIPVLYFIMYAGKVAIKRNGLKQKINFKKIY